MNTRPALMLALALVAGLTATAALAADTPPRRRTMNIAPGTPATVGQGGAVEGVVPHQAVPASRGAMSTFGGLFGTGAPRAATGSANPSPAPR
jgi:hypothetical protein